MLCQSRCTMMISATRSAFAHPRSLAVSQICILLLLFVGAVCRPAAAQDLEDQTSRPPAEVLAEVDRLVDQLGSESYDAREAAGRSLLQLGEAAWDRVYDLSQSATDLETRYRATELLKILQKRKFNAVRVWQEHSDIVWAVAFSPDNRYLASGGGGQELNGNWTTGSDFAIRIWNLKTGLLHKKLDGHKNAVATIAWYPDGNRLVSASSDNTAKVWDVSEGKELITLLGHSDRVSAVVVS